MNWDLTEVTQSSSSDLLRTGDSLPRLLDHCEVPAMAKRRSWADQMKRFFGSETISKQDKKERRKRWLFGRFKLKGSHALTVPLLQNARSLREEAVKEQSKHAMAVAVAAAVAAEAAVAAVHAAAQVVWLTGSRVPYHRTREIVALKIQTVFRGYLARKALQALKGLVKLQALIRGQMVRLQTSTVQRSLQSLMYINSEVHARRVRMTENNQAYEDKNIVQWKNKKKGDLKAMALHKSERKWDSSPLLKEEINTMFRSRLEAAFKRERAMEYASLHQGRLNLRRPTASVAKETVVPNQRWSWLDQWIATQQMDKELPMNTTETVVLLNPVNTEKSEKSQLRNLARRSSNWSSGASVRDGGHSSRSSPAFQFMNWQLSPFSSIDTGASKTGTHLLFHHKSPYLSRLTGSVKSRRSCKYLSFDSECSLLNCDRRNAFTQYSQCI